MGHTKQLNLYLFIILYNIIQVVKYSEQRPQTSDDVAYFSIADPFDNMDYQYDENPKSSEEYNQEILSPDSQKRDVQSATNKSELKASDIKLLRKKRNAETDSITSGKQSLMKDHSNPLSMSNSNHVLRKRSNKKSERSPMKKRSNRITKRSDFINGDERFPNHIIRIRSADPNDENPFGHSIPSLNIEEFNKRTEINASLLSPDKTSIKLPIGDVLSLIKPKRSTYDEEGVVGNSGTERRQEEEVLSIVNKEEISDLDVAESSIIFKPLFRYRSQIGQRRRVYNYN